MAIKYNKHTWSVFALIAVCMLIYANSLSGDFILDDWFVIVDNPKIKSAHYFFDYFTKSVWDNSGFQHTESNVLYYRPLHLIVIFASYALFGEQAFGYHFINVLFYISNVVLVYFFVRRLTDQGNFWPPFLATLIFAVHPVHTESVAWIAGVTDPLATLFFLGAFLYYLRYLESLRELDFFLSLVLFAFALLSKENTILLPVLLIAYNAIFGYKIFPRRMAFFFVMIAIYLIVRSLVMGQAIAIEPSLAGLVPFINLVVGYFKLLWVPWPLHFYFSVQDNSIISPIEVFIGWMALFFLAFFVLKNGRREKMLAFGFLWMGLTLAPSLLWAFNDPPLFAVRYLYLPSVGFTLMIAWLIQRTWQRQRTITIATSSAIIVLFSILVMLKNLDWRNEETFFLDSFRAMHYIDTYYAMPIALLGRYYQRTEQFDKAMQQFLLAAKHGNDKTKIFSYESIGLMYGEGGDGQRSTEFYMRAYALDPRKSSVLVGLGNNAWQRKDLQQALGFYAQAYAVDETNRAASYNLSLLYAALGDTAKAAYFRRIAENMGEDYIR